jgi:hypothetical protein
MAYFTASTAIGPSGVCQVPNPIQGISIPWLVLKVSFDDFISDVLLDFVRFHKGIENKPGNPFGRRADKKPSFAINPVFSSRLFLRNSAGPSEDVFLKELFARFVKSYIFATKSLFIT